MSSPARAANDRPSRVSSRNLAGNSAGEQVQAPPRHRPESRCGVGEDKAMAMAENASGKPHGRPPSTRHRIGSGAIRVEATAHHQVCPRVSGGEQTGDLRGDVLSVAGDDQRGVPILLCGIAETQAQGCSCSQVDRLAQDHRARMGGERPPCCRLSRRPPPLAISHRGRPGAGRQSPPR